VIWLFDRDGKKLKYEICKDNKGEGYMLVMTSSDGDKQVELVDQPSVVIERSIARMRQLRSDGWKIG
jgi:ribosomal protein S6